ncbi:fungal-specific transcription factor domain-containing protein [Xylariomycetidae sp. FL2044]|nr:fungal-specific transcription factor domain-containing protein [Xylariomycetidae sp. FL2044]
MSSTSSGKAPRVLACVLCQNRKIKCDRNSPCANCIKANVTCTPSTPAPARKRRRPNQDLQQRLARCEELLSEYATAKPETPTSIAPNQDDSWKALGKLVIDDGGPKFMDSYLWANIHDELSAMREIIEDEDKDTLDESSTPADNPQSPDLNAGLILSITPDTNLEDLHPQPAHVFRLWQTFLERVNPLTKVIHVPSVQPMLVEAATGRANIPKNAEALLFSIYLMAAVALSEEECLDRLGYSKDVAYARFSKGVRTSLMRIGMFKNYNIIVLQALVLLLFSLSGRYDRHGAWILNGVVVRIAQKMGLHRDGEFLGLSPFDTEMRRRIWWQIVLLDAIYAMMSGLGQSLIPRSWDTKKPRNVSDSDLYPAMATVQEKDGPTDMIFCLVSCECARMILDAPSLETLILQPAPNTDDVEKARRRIDELDISLQNIFNRFGDLSMGPVHELATLVRPMMINKIRAVICPPREQPEWGTEILTAKDNIFKFSVTAGEHNLPLYASVKLRAHFMWFMTTHFQLELLIFMVGQLSSRIEGRLVDRAWEVAKDFYQYHRELYDMSYRPHAALGIFAIRGWKIRERYLKEQGRSVETPDYIMRLRQLLPGEDTKMEPVDEPATIPNLMAPTNTNLAQDINVPWDQVLGFVDAGASEWDMFANAQGQTAQGAFGYGAGPAFGNTSNNNWM